MSWPCKMRAPKRTMQKMFSRNHSWKMGNRHWVPVKRRKLYGVISSCLNRFESLGSLDEGFHFVGSVLLFSMSKIWSTQWFRCAFLLARGSRVFFITIPGCKMVLLSVLDGPESQNPRTSIPEKKISWWPIAWVFGFSRYSGGFCEAVTENLCPSVRRTSASTFSRYW